MIDDSKELLSYRKAWLIKCLIFLFSLINEPVKWSQATSRIFRQSIPPKRKRILFWHLIKESKENKRCKTIFQNLQWRADTEIPNTYAMISVYFWWWGKELGHLGFNSSLLIRRLDHKTYIWVKKKQNFSSPGSHVSGSGKNINWPASHKGPVTPPWCHNVPQSKSILPSCLHTN